MEECSFCGRQAVYFERTAGVHRCDRCFKDNIKKRFRRTISKHNLLEPNDLVAAAVSGGTDSITNLQLLQDYAQYKEIEVLSLTIDEGIEGYRDESISIAENTAKELGIRQETISFEKVFGNTLDELAKISKEKNGPDICTLCGILRRTLLNQGARELGADKLAIGHNLDDVTQTIMLNYVRGDLARLYRLGPKTSGKEGFVSRIKPLREIKEKEVAIFAMLNDFGVHIDECPYVGGMRSEVRNFVNKMEKNHPTTKYKILRMFDKIRPNLPVDLEDFELGTCKICEEPATGELCRACDLLKQLDIERKEKRLISE